jgi:hypothetical protein
MDNKKVKIIKGDKEQRKLYNQQYYENNKEILKSKYTAKVECPNCSKVISKSRLHNHIKEGVCYNKKDLLKLLDN